MQWLMENLAQNLMIAGLVLLAIEVVVLGFSTFVLFFVGLAAVVTGAAIYLNILPSELTVSLLSIGIITVLEVIFLWRPMKRLQSKVDKNKAKGDLVGHSFVLTEPVSSLITPLYRYSGVDWKLVSNEEIDSGTKVVVVEADVGVFHIEKAAP